MKLHTTGENICVASTSIGMGLFFMLKGDSFAALSMFAVIVGWLGYEAFKYFMGGR